MIQMAAVSIFFRGSRVRLRGAKNSSTGEAFEPFLPEDARQLASLDI